MNWPYIFLKAGKKKPAEAGPQPPTIKDVPEAATPTPLATETSPFTPTAIAVTPRMQGTTTQDSTPKPVAVAATVEAAKALPTPTIVPPTTAPTADPAPTEPAMATRTLPAMHNVLLRPPNRTVPSSGAIPIGSNQGMTSPIKNMEQLMAEADPLKTGAVRLAERPKPTVEKVASLQPKSVPLAARTGPVTIVPADAIPTVRQTETKIISGPVVVPQKNEPVASTILPPIAAAVAHSIVAPNARLSVSNPALIPPPFPAFRPASEHLPEKALPEPLNQPIAPKFADTRKLRALPTANAHSSSLPSTPATNASAAPTLVIRRTPGEVDSPFVLKSSTSAAAPSREVPRVVPQPPPPAIIAPGSVVRRKTKMADVARIVLPPRRDETQPLIPPMDATSAVVPPAFPVSAMTARLTPRVVAPESAKSVEVAPLVMPQQDVPKPEGVGARVEITVAAPAKDSETPAGPTARRDEEPPSQVKQSDGPKPLLEAKPELESKDKTPPELEPIAAEEVPTGAEKDDSRQSSALSMGSLDPNAPAVMIKLPAEQESSGDVGASSMIASEIIHDGPAVVAGSEIAALFPISPKIDPEAHVPEVSDSEPPKVDPEAHRASPTPAAIEPEPPQDQRAPATAPEKREFHLTNGEKVAGVVLSESPEAIYLQHGTLGVLTVPRAQIAKRLVEIILINGDRIVGDIMAETADTLYVRHASLGMLTVPRAQRSTRVVEAILTDGDRILGEVLTETESFTVIRSATLGTITVPHSRIAMLNRKIEQIELKTLPPPTPELKDKA